MTKILTETYKTYGTLTTKDFGSFVLLKPIPNVDTVPFPLREQGYLEWFVLDPMTGEGKTILLNSVCMVEQYFEPVDMEVKFTLEDESS